MKGFTDEQIAELTGAEPGEGAEVTEETAVDTTTDTEGQPEVEKKEEGTAEPAKDLTATQQDEVDEAEAHFEKTGTWPENTPKWVQKTVNRATRQKHEFRIKAEGLASENQTLKERLKELEAKAPKPEFEKPKPSLDDFETEQEYIDATVDWKLEQREFENAAPAKPAPEIEKPTPQVASDLGGRVSKLHEEGPKVHADFKQVIESVPSGYFTEDLADDITQTSNPVEVAYHLAQNLDLGARLAAMPEKKRAIALGELSVKLSSPVPKKTSNAPDPITPVSGNIVNNGTTAGADMSSLERILGRG
ncbi:MAG: hypothetical protein WA003_15605 [Desulfuromonadaceae bacterium]